MPTPDFLLRRGLSPQAKFSISNRGSGAADAERRDDPLLTTRVNVRRALIERAPAQSGGQSLGYCGTGEVNAVRALQIATHSPIDERDMTIKDAALIKPPMDSALPEH